MSPLTVFFDLDGTLCQPHQRFRAVFTAACAPLVSASPMVPIEALLYAWSAVLERPGPAATLGCLAAACELCSIAPDPASVAACASALNAAWVGEQAWMTGAPDVLDHLREGGARLGIITNGPSDAQRAVIAALGLDALVEWVVVSGDAEVGLRKPASGIFAYALQRAGVEAHDAWFVGDAPVNDIQGASRVGMRTCWLAEEDEVLPRGVPTPTARISQLAELPDVLARDR